MSLRRLFSWFTPSRAARPSVRPARLCLETLEDRLTPSGTTGTYDTLWTTAPTTTSSTTYPTQTNLTVLSAPTTNTVVVMAPTAVLTAPTTTV